MEIKNKTEAIIKAAATNPGTEALCRDKEKCFRLLQENAKTFPELEQSVCGKYVTGPCTSRSR
jgi:hypothetical protein